MFFYPLIQEIKSLKESPIRFNNGDRFYDTEVVLAHCVVDLPAKSKLQGIRSHSAFSSCTFCLHPGKSIRNAFNNGKYVRYISNGTPYPKRNHQDTIQCMLDVKNEPIDGVARLSCMAAVENFDIIHSFPIDYMHQTLMGVTKTLMTLVQLEIP